MKKALVAFAILGVAVSRMAQAQNSVTLYGIIDDGINFNTNAHGAHQVYAASGILNGSRWGLRGTEDLGGGATTFFVLENGFDPNSGAAVQGGDLFGRQAYVGLGNSLGNVSLGRQYDSVVDYVESLSFASQYGGSITAHPADLDNMVNTHRLNNVAKYASRSFAGITFGGLYSLGGVAGDFTRKQVVSAGARYQGGPFTAGVGYINARNPNLSFYGSDGTVAATVNGVPGSNLGTSPVISGYASAHTYQVIGASAGYTVGAAALGVLYSNTKYMGLGDTSSGPVPTGGVHGTATFNTGEVNFRYQFTPTFLAAAVYDYTKNSGASGVGGATYNQAAVAVDYFLSKRTDLYAVAAYQHASGIDSTGKEAVAALQTLTASSNNHQAAFRVAIRHRF